jgi:hypothetical protein
MNPTSVTDFRRLIIIVLMKITGAQETRLTSTKCNRLENLLTNLQVLIGVYRRKYCSWPIDRKKD